MTVQYTASQMSVVKTSSSLKEMHIPLWVCTATYAAGMMASSGSAFALKGSASYSSSATAYGTQMHTLNSNWPTPQLFAFEASIKVTNSNGTAYAALWDITSASLVSGSTISTTLAFNVVRSGQFTLTPGHTYGITLWATGSSEDFYMSKAHLIAFLS